MPETLQRLTNNKENNIIVYTLQQLQQQKQQQKQDEDTDDLLERIEYVMTNGHDGFPKNIHLPNVKLISSNGVGYDGINVKDIVGERGILVTHTPHAYLNAETSTTALLLYLACMRNFLHCEQHARTGAWSETRKAAPLSHTADRRKIGILGMGRIGKVIAKKFSAALDCDISYHARSKKESLPCEYTYFDDLLEMAKHVECLVCIVPGGTATKHLVNANILDALGGTLINVSRGSVVDEEALIDALQKGKLKRAGLDVFEHEPHVPQALREMNNVVLLPHVGSATVETRAAMGELTVDNILQHLCDGRVLTPIPDVNISPTSKKKNDSREKSTTKSIHK
eukprot:CAMPEP_0118705828 /NCGR_PEP_ID=MMETSP0800-20121206/20126_1 /TAXON_ID=210618 ORGANISM="Striatella unipunctata, Strain CCMP2910" /NCGR_SAMPLE_ID=MMETSP0800 /ASSEMBLY_ACC=CAM_ASM_000638 /LENGTH=339 /DNA_ID=CAMNT_0006608109 /DNA_START=80 /DNA_END=1100 /DNA_ORIENTATION=-